MVFYVPANTVYKVICSKDPTMQSCAKPILKIFHENDVANEIFNLALLTNLWI